MRRLIYIFVCGWLVLFGGWVQAQERDLDAAFCVGEKAYFLKHQYVIRFDTVANRADSGFPKKIAEMWPTFPWTRVEAARELEGTVVRFFRGTETLDFDIAKNAVVAGPRPLEEVTSHFHKVQAAVSNAPTGLFLGDRVLSPLVRGGREPSVLAGRDRAVQSPYPPFWGFWYEKDLDAAVMFPDRRTFFFKGDEVTVMLNPFKKPEYVGGKRTPIYSVEPIDATRFPGLRFGLCGTWRNSYGERIEVDQQGDRIEVAMESPSGLRQWISGAGVVGDHTVTLQRTGPYGEIDGVGRAGSVSDRWDVVDWGDGTTWRRVPLEFTGLWRDRERRFILVEGPIRSGASSNQFILQAVMLEDKAPWRTATGTMEVAESDVGILEMVLLGGEGKSYRNGYYKSSDRIEWEGDVWEKWDEQGELWRDSATGENVWIILKDGTFTAQLLESDRGGRAALAKGKEQMSWDYAGQGGHERSERFLSDDARIVWSDGTFWYRMRSYGVRWKSRVATQGVISVVIAGEKGVTDKIYLNDYLTGKQGAVPFRRNRLNSATVLAPDIGDFDRLVFGLDREATAARFGSVPPDLTGELSDIRLFHRGGTEEWHPRFPLQNQSVALDSVTRARPAPAPPLPVELTSDGRGLRSIETRFNGEVIRFSLYPDNHDPYLWYYAPEDLRFVERTLRGQQWPELSFLAYQKAVPEGAPQRIESGAELNFSLQIETDESSIIDQLKTGLLARSATMRYLTGTSPWAYLEDWESAFSHLGHAWEPRYVGEDLALQRLEDFGAAFELSRTARSGLQGQKALRALELLPLPVTSTQVRLNVTAGADAIESDRVEARNMDARSSRGLRSFSEARFLADLGPMSGGDALSRNAELVRGLLRGSTGLLTNATLGYQRIDRDDAYQADIFDLDPGQVVSDWLNGLAPEAMITETEKQLLDVLAEEWYQALDRGYRPTFRQETRAWAELLDAAEAAHPQPDAFDFETLYRNRYLRFAVYYLLWIAMDEDTREVAGADESARRDSVRNYFQIRKERGPDLLNFMAGPTYQSSYRNQTAERPILGAQHTIRQKSANAPKDGTRVLRDAIRLFEGRDGALATGVGAMLQEPEFIKLPATFLNLSGYETEVAEALFEFRSEPIRPGAVILPDPTEDARLGVESVEITPFLEFTAPPDQLLARHFADNIQIGHDGHDDALAPTDIESIPTDGQVLTTLTYPTLRWTPAKQWEGRRSQVTRFALPGIGPDLAEALTTNGAFLGAHYRMQYRLKHSNGDLVFDERFPVFAGTRSLPYLNEKVDLLRVNFDQLPWKGVTPGGSVERVEVRLVQGERRYHGEFAPVTRDSEHSAAPRNLGWLVEKAAEPVDVEIEIIETSGPQNWSGNGALLAPSSIDLMLPQ